MVIMNTPTDITTLPGLDFWRAFFACVERGEEPHPYVVMKAEAKASDWGTCACCELRHARRGSRRRPLNSTLEFFGMQFQREIVHSDYPAARATFDAIQKLVEEENKL